ncbi:Aristolochene synthase in complex with 12,13 Difluorofarnesyl diphosphate [Aspergillus campestris IBT 28561]|uniref:Terpene synthase n=1 Tax=Aspergillus campestris (strain IBT 28561) TaxID=1392248 RepID=A0A2I1CR48_ASPC2|nr:Aristolochene synthase in complex with 12,13 Difluorofarnesyl diphosphate [Aspergillus campestris IBT 28561]PKY00095.1 Aristolochene synthase in complex with 12,13 Difluorofarnesyl diphosphate [Aspergillus campestris IBT 28561]
MSFSLSYLQSLLYSATIGQITSALGYQHAIHPSRAKKSEAPIPSRFTPKCQPLSTEIIKQVDGYFLTHWPFKNEKARKKFVAAGFSYVTSLYFPMAKDDRIHFACRLLTLLFLIDDLLEDMSFDEGSAYNEKLMPIARGEVLPDRSVPVEWIMYDLWESMRAHDRVLADGILEPTFTFMRAQTDKSRLTIKEMGPYLTYREKDVGKALLCSLMRFSMELHITPEEIASVREIEQNCAKHLSVVNDIMSWDKEYLAYQTGHPEGSAICSAVQVLADETSLSHAACKRVLWVMCREWENRHEVLVAKRQTDGAVPYGDNLKLYVKGLELQISGNELWSLTTLRYNSPN